MPPPDERTWLWIAAAFYFAGATLGLVSLLRERRPSTAAAYAILAAGLTFQTAGLYLRGLKVGACPLGNTFELVQFTTWSAATLYLLVGPAFRLSLLGTAATVLTATLSLASLLIPSWDGELRHAIFGGNVWIELHAALALFSYGIFGLLALVGTLYLARDLGLRRKRIDGAFAFLPSLRDLELIGRRLLFTGATLLAVALALGSVWWMREPATVNAPKLVATLAVFTAYALAALLRARNGLAGRRWAWASVALFIAALLSIAPVDASRNRNTTPTVTPETPALLEPSPQ